MTSFDVYLCLNCASARISLAISWPSADLEPFRKKRKEHLRCRVNSRMYIPRIGGPDSVAGFHLLHESGFAHFPMPFLRSWPLAEIAEAPKSRRVETGSRPRDLGCFAMPSLRFCACLFAQRSALSDLSRSVQRAVKGSIQTSLQAVDYTRPVCSRPEQFRRFT